MGKPVNLKSLDAQSSTGAGKETRTKGHYHLTLFAVAPNLDSGLDTLTVELEGSPDGTHWANVDTVSSAKELDESDFSNDPTSGDQTAAITVYGAQHEYIRARVSSFTDSAGSDLEVTAWILAGGWEGPGVRSGREP